MALVDSISTIWQKPSSLCLYLLKQGICMPYLNIKLSAPESVETTEKLL